MTAIDVLTALHSLGVEVFATDGELDFRAPKAILTRQLLKDIEDQKAEIVALLREASGTPSQGGPRCSRSISEEYVAPLSFAQERLWFLNQLEPESAAYNVASGLRLLGPLNVDFLERSLAEIVRRHEILRTTFPSLHGRPVQVIAPVATVKLSVVDLNELGKGEREVEVHLLRRTKARRPFDLGRGPLWRVLLMWLGREEHLWLLTMHHIISDGWSMGVFRREVSVFYNAFSKGNSPKLGELPFQYADYAVWQREWLKGTVLEEQLKYWKEKLAGAPPLLALPTDRPRPAVERYRGGIERLRLDATLTQALKRLSRQEKVTLFMTLLTAFKILLSRYTGQSDIIVGVPIAGRSRPGIDQLMGFFVNTLVLRTDLSGNPTFRELLARVREVSLGAYSHQDLPFEVLVEALQPTRDLIYTPLFQVFFNMLNHRRRRKKLPALTVQPLARDYATTRFDLMLYASEKGKQITLELVYNLDLFEDTTISRMSVHFHTLLKGILTDPNQRLTALPIISKSEREKLKRRGNSIRPSLPFRLFTREAIDQSLATRFEQQVEKAPEALAVKTQAHSWTYHELNRRANQVAHALLSLRGRSEERIIILMEHDAPMIACVLGVLKTGKPYVPLDPLYPTERSRAMFADSEAGAIVTNGRHLDLANDLSEGRVPVIDVTRLADCEANPGLPIAPDSIAYILYTSGSTGQPKGIVRTHRNVLHFIRNYTNTLHLDVADRLSLLASYSFSAAVMDIFGALLNGAALFPFDVRENGLTALAVWLRREKITVYHSTPTVFRHFLWTLNNQGRFPDLRLIDLGGEIVTRQDFELYRRDFGPDCLLVNGLGSTELNVSLQCFMDSETRITRPIVPVGYPVEDTEVIIMGESGEDLGLYVPGEIVIGSEFIGEGYWKQPELSAEVFRQRLGRPGWLYYTGNIGQRLADGAIEVLGRKDAQIKVRGHRVEMSEIETKLREVEGVKEAAVMAYDHAGETELAAYVAWGNHGSRASGSFLKHYLKKRLPEYMVPSAYVALERLPLTPTGKLDRRSLPPPDKGRLDSEEAYVAPRTRVEEVLATFWKDILGLERLSIHEDFFALGGHSLRAARVMARVNELFGMELPVRRLFEYPTIAALAEAIATYDGETADVESIARTWLDLEQLSDSEVQARLATAELDERR